MTTPTTIQITIGDQSITLTAPEWAAMRQAGDRAADGMTARFGIGAGAYGVAAPVRGVPGDAGKVERMTDRRPPRVILTDY